MTGRGVLGWLTIPAMTAIACGGSPTTPDGESTFATHRQVEIRVSSTGATLAARLLLPLGEGPHPGIVMVRGSDRWKRLGYDAFTANFLERGVAVWTYDRRGVGDSTGTYDNDVNDFPIYAQDVAANFRAAQARPEIDARRVGVYGFSQGGWVVPLAVSQAPEIAFTIIASGPAVTTGEEKLYSTLTGDDLCMRTDLTEGQIERRLERAGPSGFDPKPFLQAMTMPGLWQYCLQDTSVPVDRSIAVLEQIRGAFGLNFTIQSFPDCNHSFVIGGGPCESEGARPDWVSPLFDWLAATVPEIVP